MTHQQQQLSSTRECVKCSEPMFSVQTTGIINPDGSREDSQTWRCENHETPIIEVEHLVQKKV